MGKFIVKRSVAIQMLEELQNDPDFYEEDKQDYNSMENEALAADLCMSGIFGELVASLNINEEDLVVE